MNETELNAAKAALGMRTDAQGHRVFTDEGRRTAMAYAANRIKEGLKPADVSLELGLKGWTLQRWMQRVRKGELGPFEREAAGFAAVKVVSPAAMGCPVVHAPGGVRVEGLSPEQIGRLLRELVCSA
jgi:transposase